MCRSRRAALASEPQRRRHHHHQQPSASSRRTTAAPSSHRSSLPTASSFAIPSASLPTTTVTTTTTPTPRDTNNKPSTSSSSSSSSTLSLISVRTSLADDKPVLYTTREIRKATNNFLAPRLSRSTASASWRCTLRGRDAVVLQRALRGDPGAVKARLEDVCRGHHGSLVRLLGASVGSTDTVFLVYEYVRGASLADCLRNARNPDFTILSTWAQRMQVAADVAQGIEYLHHHSAAGALPAAPVENAPSSSSAAAGNGSRDESRPRRRRPPVHNRIKASSIMVIEQEKSKYEQEQASTAQEKVIHAKICHFGASEITGELLGPEDDGDDGVEPGTPRRPAVKTRPRKIDGAKGYMAPELIAGSLPSQKSDVYAFGVVLLELLSGEEPLRYTHAGSEFTSVSLVDTARDVLGSEEAGVQWDDDERRGRLRRWFDRRLRDSYPLDVADKVLQIAVQCVAKDPIIRPDMVRVAGKMSGLLLQSQQWAKKVKPPTDFSVSMAPR